MAQIQIFLDESVVELLGDSPEQIELNIHEILVLGLYQLRRLSASRAAEILDLDDSAFAQLADSRDVVRLAAEQEEHN